jgi:hypothetical protein
MKTLEKINIKGNRNSGKKEKANSAQTSPLSQARVRARTRAPSVPDRRALPVGANPRALTPSLSLSRCSVGPSCRRRSSPQCPLSLSLSLSLSISLSLSLCMCPAVPTCQSSLTSRPQSPRHGRDHVRAFSGHVLAPVPLFSPAPCSPTSPRSFAPSAKPPRPLSRSTHASRELRHRSPSTDARSAVTVAFVPRPVPR